MIQTKSIYHDPQEPSDGYRLLVMRYWPRGVKKDRVDGWMRALAPSAGLLSEYKAGGMDWPAFAARYKAEIFDSEEAVECLAAGQRLEEEHGRVTLICHEDLSKPGEHCHREVLQELLDGSP